MHDLIDELSSVYGGSKNSYGAMNTTTTRSASSDENELPSVDRKEAYGEVPPDFNAELIYSLFTRSGKGLKEYKFPPIPPERRGKRHRAANFRRLNIFRHWWKTSRLLVRISGALIFSFIIFEWDTVLPQLSKHKHKGIKMAAKVTKKIGQGGMSRSFLKGVQPFTRTIRLYMAFMRGLEATVDNRFWEVLIAEGMAFMGNRSIRWWARRVIDVSSKFYLYPCMMYFIPLPQDYEGICWKIFIITMGIFRAILPFASSFVGSRIGRQTTFAAINRLNFRWKTVQSAQDFVVQAGTFRPTSEDCDLLQIAKDVAKGIAHGDNPLEVRGRLERLGFDIIGTGAGGVSVYRSAVVCGNGIKVHLHVTPYGPSIEDEMPRYVVLEKFNAKDGSQFGSSLCSSVSGFTYSGCFFTSQEWSALKARFDRELVSFDTACKYMGYKSNSAFAIQNFIPPPTDLATLKSFVRTGRTPRKKKRDNKRWAEVRKQVDHLSRKLIEMESKGTAPKGVIIYMEGLDCAGKSSTGGLVMEALENAGYDMTQVQYNRPPTEEDLRHPWMWRFKEPSIEGGDGKERKAALVWDRGPAGDFVYGALRDLPLHEKQQRYYEFHSFEEKCRQKGILFLKLLFVTDRDSISSTLGKRLAHRRIVRDLHVWLDANSIYHERDGLKEIEDHIDPTDFIALNKYDNNLRAFYNFVLHTDHVGRHHVSSHGDPVCDYLPWLIVNTSQRHSARLQLMTNFENQLDEYSKASTYHCWGTSRQMYEIKNTHLASNETEVESLMGSASLACDGTLAKRVFDDDCVENKGQTCTALMESAPYLFFMVIIACSYLHQTWKVDFWGDVMY